MSNNDGEGTPKAPEAHENYVREELDQDFITHEGEKRGPTATTENPERRMKHLGASDDEVVPVVPPMSGPADVVGEKRENAQGNEANGTEIGEETIDPREELTPG
ncbi:MAG TPA: hypothetical protein VFR15_20265 [Chloroflexia bacterium]|nr:hypothetical protein [Chloroflexia bacterium]